MGEISLVCPGCAAEYRVPDSAIPSEGREVECSDCGHVWHADPPKPKAAPLDLGSVARVAAPPQPAAPATPPPPPADSTAARRLPESVFNILREEVEHEKRARDVRPALPPETPAEAQKGPESDPDWPATTVTIPRPQVSPQPEFLAPPPPVPTPIAATGEQRRAPTPIRPAAAGTTLSGTTTSEPARSAIDHRPATRADDAAQLHLPGKARRSGYRLGLLVAAILTLALIALYIAAPRFAGEGQPGAWLMEWRSSIDQGRFRLQEWLNALRG